MNYFLILGASVIFVSVFSHNIAKWNTGILTKSDLSQLERIRNSLAVAAIVTFKTIALIGGASFFLVEAF